MADDSLSDRARTINPSVTKSILDDLSESIAKIAAIAQIPLCADFWSYSQQVQYDYFWALSDLIEHAQQLCNQSQSNSVTT